MTLTQAKNTDDTVSSLSLIKATIAAFISAIVILVCVVLPAEFAIDITGTGKLLGLQNMGEIKQSLAQEQVALDQKAQMSAKNIEQNSNEQETLISQSASVQEVAKSSLVNQDSSALNQETKNQLAQSQSAQDKTLMSDTLTIVLENGEAAELKVALAKGLYVDFDWCADAKVNFDNHGDSNKIRYHPYSKGKGVTEDKGLIQAAFDGYHGWFWRNRSGKQVSLTINFTGEYTKVKRVL
ncbi:MAG: transmembrane anchor protein [Marinomonas sp.]